MNPRSYLRAQSVRMVTGMAISQKSNQVMGGL